MSGIGRALILLVIVLLLALGEPAGAGVAHAFTNASSISDDTSPDALERDFGNPVVSQTGFEEGVVSNEVDTSSSPGDVQLAQRTWYLNYWPYRKPVTITNNSGGALTNYQVEVTVNTQELISANKMESDGADIRFTQSDGDTLISYWMESGINTISTDIWVKVPSVPTGDSTIYMYYGNPHATAVSSASDTFSSGSFTDSFTDETKISSSSNVTVSGGEVNLSGPNTSYDDEFNDGSLDAKWTWYNEPGCWSRGGSWDEGTTRAGCLCMLTDTQTDFENAQDSAHLLYQEISGDFEMETRAYNLPNTWAENSGMVVRQDADNYLKFGFGNALFQVIYACSESGGSYSTLKTILESGSPKYYKLRRTGDLWETWYHDDGVSEWTAIHSWTQALTDPVKIGPYAADGAAWPHSNHPTEFDYFRVTKYDSGSVTSVTVPTDTDTRFAVGTQLSWNDSEPTGSDLKYQLYYLDGTWQLIPDADLPGNSTGFDTSPVDISSVKTDYGQIRLKANFSDGYDTATLEDWTVTYYYREYTATEPSAGAPGTEEVINWQRRGYRKPVAITNGSGEALNNYQVKVTVNTQELISAGHMESDGDDIIFTEPDGDTEISYWIESGINTTSTSIWVNIPYIPTTGTTIYMYYGYSDATAASSVSDTFSSGSFTDSFTDETKISSSNNVTVSGGEVSLTVDEQSAEVAFSDSFGDGHWDDNGATNWFSSTDREHDGTYSIKCDDNPDGYLTSDDIDLSSATSADLDFWFQKVALEATDFELYFYDGSTYNLIDDLDDNGADNTWLNWDNVSIDLGTYGISNFRIRFNAHLEWPFLQTQERVWVDQLVVTADSQTVFSDSFDFEHWDDNGATNWFLLNDYSYDGTHSVKCDHSPDGYLTSDDIDLSDAAEADLDFWFMKIATEATDFELYFYDGSTYNLIDDLDDNGADSTWLNWDNVDIDLDTYGVSNFRIRFNADLEWPFLQVQERVWVDQLVLTKTPAGPPGDVTSVTIPTDTTTRFATGTQLSWNDTEPTDTDIKYYVYYLDGTWQLIPDADLPGNSTGFDTSPVDISSAKTDYDQIRLKADLTSSDPAGLPSIQDWTITYYYRQYTDTEPSAGTPGTEEGSEPGGVYASPGTIASEVFDLGTSGASWVWFGWSETLPAGTDITFEVRASDTSFDADATTPSWTSIGGTSPVTSSLPSGRYQQWRATLTTSDASETPLLLDVRALYS